MRLAMCSGGKHADEAAAGLLLKAEEKLMFARAVSRMVERCHGGVLAHQTS
jgi:hypothetical protein